MDLGYMTSEDHALAEYVNTRRAIEAAGGIKRLCCPSRWAGADPPWVSMPTSGRRFNETGSILVSAMTEGIDYAIITFRVPPGNQGVITQHFQVYTGTAFREASGDIAWRIRRGNPYVYGFGNMLTSLGSFGSPNPIASGGMLLESNQLIRYYAMLGTGASARLDPNERIVVSLQGWFYPAN